MSTLNEISEAMQKGRAKLIKTLVPQALEEGIPAYSISAKRMQGQIPIPTGRTRCSQEP